MKWFLAWHQYLIDLLLPREQNKTLVELASIVLGAERQALHHFLHDAPGDGEVLNRRRLEIWQAHPFLGPHAQGELIVDETGDAKRGNKDPAFQTKPQLAWTLIQEAQAAGIPFRLVVADSVYGESSQLEAYLVTAGIPSILGLRPSHGTWQVVDDPAHPPARVLLTPHLPQPDQPATREREQQPGSGWQSIFTAASLASAITSSTPCELPRMDRSPEAVLKHLPDKIACPAWAWVHVAGSNCSCRASDLRGIQSGFLP